MVKYLSGSVKELPESINPQFILWIKTSFPTAEEMSEEKPPAAVNTPIQRMATNMARRGRRRLFE
jgi:hypothetical protein